MPSFIGSGVHRFTVQPTDLSILDSCLLVLVLLFVEPQNFNLYYISEF